SRPGPTNLNLKRIIERVGESPGVAEAQGRPTIRGHGHVLRHSLISALRVNFQLVGTLTGPPRSRDGISPDFVEIAPTRHGRRPASYPARRYGIIDGARSHCWCG